MNYRVAITGMGVVAPNGVGLPAFTNALMEGQSGIRHFKELEELKFSCQIGGKPAVTEEQKLDYFTPLQLRGLQSSGIIYGYMAGLEAFEMAGFTSTDELDLELGVVFGAGILGADKFATAIKQVDEGKVRRLGSTVVIQIMTSGISAMLAGAIGAGNQVTTNSSACSTGTEAILMAAERIRYGKARRVLCGSCSEDGPYVWGGFDAMRVMTYKHNDSPQQGSRPMSATASGFVPGSGAGALMLERWEDAVERGARIYGELLGGHVNSGGQKNGGSMTAPNPTAVQHCISKALEDANVLPEDIDLINGHLTATIKDPEEIQNWTIALGRKGIDFPIIQSTKSLIGHSLAAAGAIETVATLVQMNNGFLHPSINTEDLHPAIADLIDQRCISKTGSTNQIKTAVKASFGFGDVNAVLVIRHHNTN